MELQDLIYEYLSKQQDARLITLDETEEYFLADKKYQDYDRDIQERLKIKLHTGKCSNILVQQLAKHRCNLGEVFGEKVEFYSASELCDLIELIELGKVEGESFNGNILRGFYKVHHGSYSDYGYSIVRNIKEFWFKNKKIKQTLISDYQEILDKCGEQNISTIMNTMHTKAMREKSTRGEIKGEWLIYKRLDDRNYYLCLAIHDEGDENIYNDKLEHCLLEFPELNETKY
ncbi:MAG: hypothetical protein MJA30_21500 [Cytophagales bacterium]|nr:hypothetical protein [Cytophagales bacterium]